MKIFKCRRNYESKVWCVFAILFLGCLAGLYGIVYAVDGILPTPLEISDEDNNPDAFIAERARNYHKGLIDLGPRVVGTYANEVSAVEYLIGIINDIIQNANPIHTIELSLQSVSGSFSLGSSVRIRAYANVQNIVVKVNSPGSLNYSVLVNTHFDSAPTSPGGSDDGINVAVALEVLTKISRSPTQPTNEIIFLFNGAEETGLLASHGFITQHEWRHDVRVFINLEAAGAGGREMLFQSGPEAAWLLSYYDVPHPHCSAMAEELFQSGVIPSDTDFRIFRDFGDLIGYDFAYTRDGYRYHTKYDGFDNIDYGTYQHTGDNVLHLVRRLAEAPEVMNQPRDGKIIFFDFIGLFYIYYYDNSAAIIVNTMTIAISFAVMLWSCVDYKTGCCKGLLHIFVTIVVTIIGIAVTAGFALLIAVILDAANATMSWYRIPPIVIGLYVAPIIFFQLLTTTIIDCFIRKIEIPLTQRVLLQIHANRCLWTLAMMVGAIMQFRSIYVLMIPIFFSTVAMLIIQSGKLYNKDRIWPVIYIISTILPSMMIMYTTHEYLALFIPIMGRFGSTLNPDILIGLMLVLMTVKVISYYAPLFLYIREKWIVLLFLMVGFIVTFILVLTPIGFQYEFNKDNPRLQRYATYHTQEVYKDEIGNPIGGGSGFFISKYDRNSPYAIANYVTSVQEAIDSGDVQGGGLIPAGPPTFPIKLNYSCTKEEIPSHKVKYDCSILGTDRINVYLSIWTGPAKLISLSLLDEIPENISYFSMSFVYGKEPASVDFDFVVERVDHNYTGPFGQLDVSAWYVHEELIEKTEEYEKFLGEFPDWTVVTAGLTYYETIRLS